MFDELSKHNLETLVHLRHETIQREVAQARQLTELRRVPAQPSRWQRWMQAYRARFGSAKEISHAGAAT